MSFFFLLSAAVLFSIGIFFFPGSCWRYHHKTGSQVLRIIQILFFGTNVKLSVYVCLFVFTGKAKTKEARQTIINPDWNFEKMGIGGLDKEFSDIFRRAFASRVFPPDIVEQMGEGRTMLVLFFLLFFFKVL